MPAEAKLGAICRALAAILLLSGAAPAALAQVAVATDAIETPGAGTLTMCRNWLLSQSCSTYHRIALPELVAIGDQFKVRYGSNPKIYMFHVAQIVHHDGSCTILSDAPGSSEQGERLEIAPCRPAPPLPPAEPAR